MVYEAHASAHSSITTNSTNAVLVVGASGSIGRHVVAESLRAGFETRALVRDPEQALLFPEATRVVVGDPADAGVLAEALEEVTGVVLTQGTYRDADAERVNYRPVKAVLDALRAPARIALMTTLGVTKPTTGHDCKRRAERLVRASGLPYTIVRPGWFDYNEPDQHRLVLLQGDRRWASSPEDGVVSRAQIAQVLVASLTSDRCRPQDLRAGRREGQCPGRPRPAVRRAGSGRRAGRPVRPGQSPTGRRAGRRDQRPRRAPRVVGRPRPTRQVIACSSLCATVPGVRTRWRRRIRVCAHSGLTRRDLLDPTTGDAQVDQFGGSSRSGLPAQPAGYAASASIRSLSSPPE